MAKVYYGCPTPAVKELVQVGKIVLSSESVGQYDWAPRHYCKDCGIGFPSFSRT